MKFEIVPDAREGKFRWQLIGDDGEILAMSPLAYTLFDCSQRVKLIKATAAAAGIEIRKAA